MDLSALPDPVRARYDALLAVAGSTVVGLDFDGTLSPIVPDPAQAHIHPDGPDVLVALATQVRAVAIVTGRPARQVVELGRLDEVADRLPEGAVLLVRGQYGHERWDSATREFHSAEVPPGLAALAAELPDLLAAADARDAYVEDKGLARVETPLADAAERHGLALEPGKLVLELRTPGAHKGHALREVVAGTRAGGVLFGGDDLGDLEAFEAARAMRDEGMPTLLVCSGSAEERALAEIADLVVPGPPGVLELLRQLAVDAAAH